jgi:glycosyltransferase involved in cell wall biosynthesis
MRSLSIIIPTYNNEDFIGNCLNSIFKQDYPKELMQIIVADGGSTDRTLDIVKKFNVKIVHNKFRIEEKGRAYAIKNFANGEIIGLIDADNVIPDDKEWIKKMLKPFEDEEIFATDTLYFSFRKKDNLNTKYGALVGGDDPIASYLGINDRICYFTNKWTQMPHKEKDKKDYIEVTFEKGKIPSAGSNGFFFRKKMFDEVPMDPFIHPIFIYELVNLGHNKMAKVKQGIFHVQKKGLLIFFRKKLRRIKRRQKGEVKWKYNYDIDKKKIIKTSLHILSIIPVLIDTMRAFHKKPSWAVFFHPFATIGLFFVYSYYSLVGSKSKSFNNQFYR